MSEVSVVIPTCNRRDWALSLIERLARSTHRPLEVVVVDSSDQPLSAGDVERHAGWVRCLTSRKSVCVQRNLGVQHARGRWILLCDDDVEVPADYLDRLLAHVAAHPEAGAVTGLFLEHVGGEWVGQFPVTSPAWLLWARVFNLGLWGEIRCHGPLGAVLAAHYHRRGNHITTAGWPALTDFQAPYFRTPVYSLGAALVRREWLVRSPFDESLDRHGYGDNYGVAIGFPAEGIHVLTGAFVRHHKAPADRPAAAFSHSRRIFALDRFIATRPELSGTSRRHLAWSLVGDALHHAAKRRFRMSWSTVTTLSGILRGRNPYLRSGS